jgi:hypothetical protein
MLEQLIDTCRVLDDDYPAYSSGLSVEDIRVAGASISRKGEGRL